MPKPQPEIRQAYDSDLERYRYTPHCDACGYVGPTLSDKTLARMCLRRHFESRKHKVNFKSPTRFTA
jgi:hypothetical protein